MNLSRVLWIFCIFSFCFSFDMVEVKQNEADISMCSAKNSKNFQIYCGGRIVAAVNLHMLFNDSKDFVDKPLVFSPEATFQNFNTLFGNLSIEKINPLALKQFVDKHFLGVNSDVIKCTPDGWKPFPPKLMEIKDPILRKWALTINGIWKKLCKQVHPKVYETPEKFSIIPLRYKFIVPGGRFREIMFWDSYWIIKGLLASEMHEAAAQMILNFADFIKTYNFIPNGGRVYFLQRSQPPLFIPMVYEYYKATKNAEFVKQLLPLMEKEFNFWQKHRRINLTINDKSYFVYRYSAGSNVPRPESYKEDFAVNSRSNKTTKAQKQKLFRDIAAAAESGWDFSTRWFSDNHSLKTIETTNILPVDLNAFLCWNMNILSYFFKEFGENKEKAEFYGKMFVDQKKMFEEVFYNSTHKVWLDFNLRTKHHIPKFYAGLIAPLFTNCYDTNDVEKVENLLDFFNRSRAFNFIGGVPATVAQNAKEQWDFPNGWGNLNHMIVEGFRNSKSFKAQAAAFEIAKTWIQSNYNVFKATGHLWEKYDVTGLYPTPGQGGEYAVQDGFGLTNGAILDLLLTYKNDLIIKKV